MDTRQPDDRPRANGGRHVAAVDGRHIPAVHGRHICAVDGRHICAVDGRHIAAVDGMRALAVLGVIAFHFGLPVRGGFLGVDLFFVISGYVITRLLLGERARSGRIALPAFWARRAYRLFPAVLVVLVAVQLWMHWAATATMRTTTNAQTLAALMYVSNWYSIFGHVGYWGLAFDQAPLNHLWSLAVEEQFYLIWPPMVAVILGMARSRRALAVTAAAGALTAYTALHLLFTPGAPDRAYLGTDCRVGALALGGLLAVFTTSAAGTDRRSAGRHTTPAVIAAGGCLGWLWATARLDAAALYYWQLPLAGLAATVLIGGLVLCPDGRPARIAGSRPLVAIGRLSYSLYLWHWPVWVLVRTTFPLWPDVARVALAAIVTVSLAIASYHLVENPMRYGRRRLRTFLPGLIAIASAVACSAILLQPARPVEQRNDILITGP